MSATARQREVFAAVLRARPAWYRAAHPGQRVTLASLFRAGVLVRRARRGVDGAADAAYEYQASPEMSAQVPGSTDEDTVT